MWYHYQPVYLARGHPIKHHCPALGGLVGSRSHFSRNTREMVISTWLFWSLGVWKFLVASLWLSGTLDGWVPGGSVFWKMFSCGLTVSSEFAGEAGQNRWKDHLYLDLLYSFKKNVKNRNLIVGPNIHPSSFDDDCLSSGLTKDHGYFV